MARQTSAMRASQLVNLRRSSRKRPSQPGPSPPSPKRRNKYEEDEDRTRVKLEDGNEDVQPPMKAAKSRTIKQEQTKDDPSPQKNPPPTTQSVPSPLSSLDTSLAARKLRLYYGTDGTHATTPASPFPDFAHPTAAECRLAHSILASLHGPRERPTSPPASGPAGRAGCGDAPTVLDALVRTILSQNTTDANSARAKRAMDAAYGGRHDNWAAVAAGGTARLEDAIRCGGLAAAKSRVIISILERLCERHASSSSSPAVAKDDEKDQNDGIYSLEHVRDLPTADAMRELLSFRGVGPKTASCVLLFCLGRDSFAVDTHVHRIAGLLGWRPPRATRDETHLHLDARVPDADKYGLHVLMVTHGKRCAECKAGGRAAGRCGLRKAFRGREDWEV